MKQTQEYIDETNELQLEFSKENLIPLYGTKDENGRNRLYFKPLNSNEVWKSKEFYSLLNTKHLQRNYTIKQLQLFLEKTIQLDSQINRELKSG